MIGKTISHYKILEKLGEGGMGAVYKAEDVELKRIVALKFLSPRALGGGEEKDRFVHEAQAAAALDHTGICTVHEIAKAEGHTFIAMAYVEGQSLKERIESGPLALDQAVGIAIQVAEGLKEAHGKGIVHRDIKPGNIMVTPKGQAKIMDFGLAKSPARTTVTQDGTTVGTFAYMSPEQTRGESVDGRTDIWSLGVVLYEMVTGQRPFKGDYEQAVVYSILNTAPEPVTALHDGAPPELERIVEKALAKNPEERYQSMTEIAADLGSAARQLESDDAKTVSSGHAQAVPSRQAQAVHGGPVKRRTKRVYLYGVLIALVAAVLVTRIVTLPGRSEPIESIAVLPLDNLSGNPEQEYFADGMTDELIANLAKISALRVISRTSAMRYKDTDKTLPQIARELNVDAVVEGSVLRSGDRVRITAQLIHAPTDKHLWAESYERDLSDVLSLQREVAQSIARKIKVALTPQENDRLATATTVNPAAHQAYLKGRYNLNTLKVAAHEKAIEWFEQAIEEDPAFALAYAGLGEAYDALACFGSIPPKEAWPRVKAEALKALERDEGLAEAHALLADVKYLYEWDWEGAEREFKRTIELSPGYADAHSWYSLYLSSMGRHDEAIAEAKMAVEVDPLSLGSRVNLGGVLANARQYGLSIEQLKEAYDLAPDSFLPHYHLATVYCFDTMFEEARAEIQRAGDTPDPDIGLMAEVYARLGEADRARELLGGLLERSKDGYVPALDIACIYAPLGEKEQALEWLEAAYDERSTWLVDVKVDPKFDNLRSDPRFSQLLRKMGLGP